MSPATADAFQGQLLHTTPPNNRITAYFAASRDDVIKKDVEELPVIATYTPPQPRLSPRKHAATTSILQQSNNLEKKSPHRIEIVTTQLKKTAAPKSKQKLTEVAAPCKTAKLTDYFPVRRSVRKTKKTVLEEKQRHIENAVLSEREDGLEVHYFPGKGRGVVATREFNRGDFVVEYAGELISMEKAREREAKYALDQNTGCYMYYFMYKDVAHCVDATAESKRLGRLVNHSRNGNLVTKSVSIGGRPRLVLIAKDHIQPGDELMYDYGDRSKESLYYHPWLAL